MLIGLVAAWLIVAVLVVLVYQLILQHGRTLLRIESLEAQQASTPAAADPLAGNQKILTPGVAAPPINLPDLTGAMRTLSEWRGRRVLLVFAAPDCMYSKTLAPYLSGLLDDPVLGRPVPVVVSTGSREANREMFDAAGFSGTVLLQEQREVATAYRVDGTPMSYLIEADGTVASKVAAGVQATMILAGDIASVADATDTSEPLPIEKGVTPRAALGPGETAPVFRLPCLEGGELSLLTYRGRQVVLVFSDPNCAPCDDTASQLEAHYRRHPELPIVMISRGEPEESRAKAAELGITFPIAVQRHWEISREYGIFATPVAFLVDEWGVIAADVAVGTDEIMALVRQAM